MKGTLHRKRRKVMILKNGDSKRVGIFFFYDKDGIVDDYIMVLLNALKSHFERIVVVVNGKMSVEGRRKLTTVTTEIVVRENKGFDSWAYKAGHDYIGWENLKNYDELIMFNFTIMGPVNSFDDMFKDMDSRDVDFWGITEFFGAPFDPFGCIKYGYLPDHLQSHFIAIRKSMFLDNAYKRYWDELPAITCYEEAVGKHEAIFTKTFADIGFSWESYVEMEDLRAHNIDEIIYNPIKLVKERKCPIFKRRMFIHDYNDVLRNSIGNVPSEFIDFLIEENRYDVKLIYDNIIRSGHQEDFARNLNLNYVLASTYSQPIDKKIGTALVMHIYYEDMIEQLLSYAENMPEDSDIYITVVSSKTYDLVKDSIKYHSNITARTDVRIIENRGRDVSSVLVGVKDVIMNYDLVCFIHDKKTPQLPFASIGEGFANVCYGNIIYSKNYVNNVIALFSNNERIGLASPPYPAHADFFGGLGFEWGTSYEVTMDLYKKMGLTVPACYEKKVIAPYGTCFWFRPKAFKLLYDMDWDYDDFPKEPNRTDGTILHAVERIYPLVVQQMGYFPVMIMSDYYAGLEYAELEYYMRHYNKVIFKKFGPYYFDAKLKDIENVVVTNNGQSSSAVPNILETYQCDKDCTPAGPTWKRTIYWMLFDHDTLKWKIHNKFHKSKG